ncbi:helix-turn-helix transcriptional regulator [Neoroseomonas lacus]|uniref:helix-turn-helix transcriptional regulator n=1 Tax=Neoroseomonas lacus TaxID=287609 RepID=UPI00166474CE|nr:helix-turn-helix transcriptional regulator [Neoroseomonas lacus]
MSENPWGIAPLNWRALVDEALRRRKAEKLTQREHAALASVSVPTMATFERGETTLTLSKAFDILRVVGLVDEQTEQGAQEAFVREAFERWRRLTEGLPKDSPGRFPHGWYRFDYCVEGDLKTLSLTAFEEILDKAVTRHTGWPVFWVPQRPEIAPREVDGTIECWLAPEGHEGIERGFSDAAHSDFWRAAPSGRLFLIRGYQEDSQETFSPGTIMDTTLPIWRMGEALLHAEKFGALMRGNDRAPLTIRFRALYSGLGGRVLRSWANPLADLLIEGHAARSDEAMLETAIPAQGVTARLAEHLFPLVSSLYERFGVVGLSESRVKAEVDRLLNSRSR